MQPKQGYWFGRAVRSVYGRGCDIIAVAMMRSRYVEGAAFRFLAAAGPTRAARSLRGRLADAVRRRSEAEPIAWRWAKLTGGAWLQVDIRKWVGGVYFGQVYEPETTRHVLGWLGPGDVFIDIGANVGYFTMLAAARVGPLGRVIAVEANPALFQRLCASVERNGFQMVDVFDVAATDHDAEISLYLSNDPTNDGISSTSPWEGHLASGDLSASNTVVIPGRRLDTLPLELGRVDLLKIDVEGAELAVLNGMAEIFAKTPPRRIVCETTLSGEISEWLTVRGYKAEPLEYLKPESEWGNILYVRQ